MNQFPTPDSRMYEFKYLAFLSYTARHFRKWSKKHKTASLILVIFLILFAVSVAVLVIYNYRR
jgi:hypothetical protein